jgi:hypothetical protein
MYVLCVIGMQCALLSKTRQTYACDGHYVHLRDTDRPVVAARAAIDELTLLPYEHLCLHHYNTYIFNWKGNGCIDPQCTIKGDVHRGLVRCPNRCLPVFGDAPAESLIHQHPCLRTFDQRYCDHAQYIPPSTRQRKRSRSTSDQHPQKVYTFIIPFVLWLVLTYC